MRVSWFLGRSCNDSVVDADLHVASGADGMVVCVCLSRLFVLLFAVLLMLVFTMKLMLMLMYVFKLLLMLQ